MPDDGAWNTDGSRMQGWLQRSLDIRTVQRPGGLINPQLGLVIKRHDKDAETNVNGNTAEYDVLLFDMYQVIYNVAVKSLRLNTDTGDIAVLKPASDIPNLKDPTTANQNMLSSDGDLVCVEFISRRFPVISGCMNHIKSGTDTAPYYPIGSEGEVRKIYHKGSEFTMQEDGDIVVNVPANKSVVINIDGTQALKLTESGGSIVVELGTTATEALVLGDSFKTWLEGVYNAHTHNVVAIGSPTDPPSVSMNMPASTLSTIVKTE